METANFIELTFRAPETREEFKRANFSRFGWELTSSPRDIAHVDVEFPFRGAYIRAPRNQIVFAVSSPRLSPTNFDFSCHV